MYHHKPIHQISCGCFEVNKCNCPPKLDTNKIFIENINDIAGSLAEVMMVCGIHEAKARASGEVIMNAFLYFDEIRHRIDALPKKRFRKTDLMFLLSQKCLMSRLESQLAYSIIKRAFKAYYHGTDLGGISNPILEAQLIHTQECFWLHAAKRTAQIFAAYEGLFQCAQKYYEKKIKCIYTHLYERIKARSDPIRLKVCQCDDCVKQIIRFSNATSDGVRLSDLNSGFTSRKNSLNNAEGEKIVSSKTSLHLERCNKCNCPKLVCDCDIQMHTGILTAECSQGPFICRWVLDNEEEKLDPCILLPDNHQCPVDCYEVSYECDSDCECICEECECSSKEEIMSVFDEFDYTDKMSRILVEVEEEQSMSGVSPPSIDLTPMHLRLPHPAFDCCRVAPETPINYKDTVSEPKSERKSSASSTGRKKLSNAKVIEKQISPIASRRDTEKTYKSIGSVSVKSLLRKSQTSDIKKPEISSLLQTSLDSHNKSPRESGSQKKTSLDVQNLLQELL